MFRNRSTIKTIASIIIVLLLLFPSFGEREQHTVHGEKKKSLESEVNIKELETSIIDIINWKKSQNEPYANILFTNDFLENAGDSSTDWYVLGLGRAGLEDDFASYLAVIKDTVEKRYQTDEKLSTSKATEWHRISLAILSAGGDPTNVGTDDNGDVIDLIADGTYNRGDTTRALGSQGINGWIWGLITLDSLRYNVPDNAVETRNSMIEEILRAQLEDGGFSLNTHEKDSNVDLTAMAIQALAPYYNSEETYTYEQISTDKKVTKKVRDVVDEALQLLSELQLDDGDYELTGLSNVESTAQVTVALTALGIDPLQDERFIKNGNTLLDAVLRYQMPDGGFIHSGTLDEENDYADPNESNSMASEQVLYTFISLYRLYDEKRVLYDFRKEMSDEVVQKVNDASEAIEQLPDKTTSANEDQVEKAFQLYEDVPISERSYVYNYSNLADAMETLKIDNSSEYLAEHIGENDKGNGNNIALFTKTDSASSDEAFTKEDKVKVDELLAEKVSTEFYVEVVTFLDKLYHEDTEQIYKKTIPKLEEKKKEIEEIEEDLEQLNQKILDDLYPFNDISTEDKEVVDEVIERYETLTSYDQEKIQGYEDVEKAAIQINNLTRAKYIAVSIIIIVVGAGVLLVIRYRKRKQETRHQKMLDYED